MAKKTKEKNAPAESVQDLKAEEVNVAEVTTEKTKKRTTRKKKAQPAESKEDATVESTTVDAPANENNAVDAPVEEKPKKRATRKSKKEVTATEKDADATVKKTENEVPETETQQPESPKEQKQPETPKQVTLPPCPTMLIKSIIDLVAAPHRQLLLNDQQIQMLTVEDAQKRFRWIEGTLAWVLNYDIVISDTNIWLELLVGHTSSHSDPRVNARLQFERQLEFISKLVRFRKGKFMMMAETYEEIDRFASQQEPTNYKDADFKDEATCRNISARLAKRLILSLQRENRLRIEGIGSESHHAAFADPAIIRRTVELFAQGKKVLLLTNDASVAIRSMGMCDDLQRHNNIDDDTWEQTYVPLRPMVMTMDDLRQLDLYTRQYHFLQMAAGKQWMEDVPQYMEKRSIPELSLWLDGFRPGDKHRESKNQEQRSQEKDSKKQEQQPNKQQKQQQQQQQQKQQQKQQQQKQQQQKQKAEAKAEQKPEVNLEQKQETKVEQTVDTSVSNTEPAQQNVTEQSADAPVAEEPKKKASRRGRGGRRKPKNEEQG